MCAILLLLINEGRIVTELIIVSVLVYRVEGKTIAVGNGDPISMEADGSNNIHTAFMMCSQLIIHPKDHTGKSTGLVTSKPLTLAIVSF